MTDVDILFNDPSSSGEMAGRMRSLDWGRTPLGPVEGWSPSLRAAVRVLLASRYPMLVCWGPEYVQLYNDAYRPVLGATKHPEALGQRASDCWPEIWHVIGPMFDRVMAGGAATWDEDMLFVLDRNRYVEETYFTFSYSAFPGDGADVGGVLVTCVETTGRVLGERRLRALRDLGELAASARSREDACTRVAETLSNHAHDVPFALLYLVDGHVARLAAASGLDAGSPLAPEEIAIDPADGSSGGNGRKGSVAAQERRRSDAFEWPLLDVVLEGQARTLRGLSEHLRLPGGPWPEPCDVVELLPVASTSEERPAAVLVAGTSPRRALDDDYRDFLQLVANNVSAALGSARAYEEARRRAETLAELDRLKTDFFSNVSHEFRTPLTLMLGPLEEILLGDRLEESVRDRVEVSLRNGMRLLKLVNAVLDFSRIEAGRMEAALEPVDLAALTTDLASTFRSAMQRGGLELVVDVPDRPLVHTVDRSMWEKIVLNLLSNALKFTLEGRVTITLAEHDGDVVLEVSDTGVGVPASEVTHLFERFRRVRTPRSRTHEGAGIGLALVRELAQLHGGSVSVDSVEGRGSTFRVRLPRRRDASAGEPPTPEPLSADPIVRRPFLEEALVWFDTEASVSGPPSDPTGLSWPSLRGGGLEVMRPSAADDGRVLVVDDNADMRRYLVRLLSPRWGVTAVADGAEALRVALEERPDLVVSDVMMPGMDGFELLRALRADPRTRETPILLLSARAGEDARVAALDAGADDYLVKPFSARELVARVGALVELIRLRQASDNVLSELVARITDGFWVLDREWVVRYVNELGAELLGKDPSALVGRSLWELFPEAEGSSFYEAHRRAMSEQTPQRVEDYYEPLKRWFEVRIYPSESGVTVFHTDVTERHRAAEELRRAHDHLTVRVAERTADLRELSRRLMNAREDERRRLATALHDDLGQLLTALSLSLQRTARQHPQVDEEIREALDILDQGLEQVREASFGLRPPILDELGITAALDWYRNRHADLFQFDLEFEAAIAGRLPTMVETACYRIALEALTNAARHSRAKRVSLSLREVGRSVELRVQDDGRGFSVDDRSQGQHGSLGLVGMKEMASLANGSLRVESSLGAGTVVHASFDLDASVSTSE